MKIYRGTKIRSEGYSSTDGSLLAIIYFRTNEIREKIEFYHKDGITIKFIDYYTADGIKEKAVFFEESRSPISTLTITAIVYFRPDGTIEKREFYDKNGDTIVYHRADGTTERSIVYNAQGKIRARSYFRLDGTLERIEFTNGVVWYYEADGKTRIQQ